VPGALSVPERATATPQRDRKGNDNDRKLSGFRCPAFGADA
jgi:hypothetical protein